jgi:hypothetical protein
MKRLLLISGCVLVLSGSAALAQTKPSGGPTPNSIRQEQMALAPNESVPTRHVIAYTDSYGFHFDRNGVLVDANGYPITPHP